MKWSILGMVTCFMFAYLLLFVVGDEFWFYLGYLYALGGFFWSVIIAFQLYTGESEL